MKKENRGRILRRYAIILVVAIALSARIIYVLADTTVTHAADWNELANKELQIVEAIQPTRGDILACDGSVLATNIRIYTAALDYRDPSLNEDTLRARMPAIADSMARYFPSKTRTQWKQYLLKPFEIKKEKRPRSWVLVRDVAKDSIDLLKTFAWKRKRNGRGPICGMAVTSRLARIRPYGAMARRSIGAVGMDSASTLIHGKYGLEKALDTLLYGTPGLSRKVALTSAIVDWADKPPRNGYSVLTTIDIKMQDILENELNKMLEYCGADWGTALLIETKTGDIKAISNLELDPVSHTRYIESLNRAVQGIEPGSVVKTLSMLIALEDGIVTNLNEVIPTGTEWHYYGTKPIKDSHYTASLRVEEVLEHSSNIAMAKIITRRFGRNPTAFHDRLKQLGFLDAMNAGLAGEEVPRFERLNNSDSARQKLSRMSYGYVSEISPLYTASLYNAIANDGVYVRPRLVRGLRTEDWDTIYPVTYMRPRICSERNAATLRRLLSRVVWGPHGTARLAVKSDRVRIIGKTGTANINRRGIGYTNGVNRVAFCGIFPEEAPQYTCMVVVSYPKRNAVGAAATSGTVVRRVAEAMYARGMIRYDADISKISPDSTGVHGRIPTMYAALDTARNSRVQRALALGTRKAVIQMPPHHSKGVPSVLGLGMRDALNLLERAGYNVHFKGCGYVAGQLPVPGTHAAKGSKVYLTLKE